MKKSISLICVLLMLLSTLSLSAKQVDEAKARRVAIAFAQQLSPLRQASDMQLVMTSADMMPDGLRSITSPLFYIYNRTDGQGFVIVAGDDLAVPVLGYSNESTFETENMPPNLTYWLSFYADELAWAIEQGYQPTAENLQLWENDLTESGEEEDTEILLATANWNQSAPYNRLCPEYNNKGCYTGCVATAMAIIMKYHEWPLEVSGKVSYRTRSHNLLVSARLDHAYAWDKMKMSYASIRPDYSEEEADAVARLMFDCGASVAMDYKSDGNGSGAYNAQVVAMRNLFDYDKGAYSEERDLVTEEEWVALIREEISARRPIFYSGSSANGAGHAFVLDGYKGDNYHFNWGWGGVSNGYFKLSSLSPGSIGIGGGIGGYNYNQTISVKIQKPAGNPAAPNTVRFFKFVGYSLDFFGIKSDREVIKKDEEFRFYFSYLAPIESVDSDAKMGFWVVDKDGNRKDLVFGFNWSFAQGFMYSHTQGTPCTVTTPLEEGDQIQLFCQFPDEEWQAVRGPSDATLALPVEPSENSSIGAVNGDEAISVSYQRETAQITISSENDPLQELSLYDLSGRLVLSIRTEGETHATLSIADRQPGTYILSVRSSIGVTSHKINKQ
ncbi:thiol protease/hemagglutinin PrtT [Parabacteroides sp. OttesenSCG-928-N08]|nr:thiol protease/hemagglutinin PrtT [Parabacteroides sp. OttesenSCG-928-N08]